MKDFLDASGNQIRGCRRHSLPNEKPIIGYWWLWPSPIVSLPWHAPGTWAELRQIGARLKVDVDGFIRWMANRVGGREAVIVLLGYPIPTLWHTDPVEVHWQAIIPPDVPKTIRPMNGFRANSLGRSERLRRDIFSGAKKLSYLKTANWHPNRLQARGRLPSEVRTRSVAVIGAGALGSAVAELLARGGVTDILIIDHENLEAGNLVRHTLTGADLGRKKAEAIKERLQNCAPMSRISSQATCLPSGGTLQTLLEPFDIVLDCTADDSALHHLSEVWWSIPRYFLSSSMGFAANRLFLFGVHACTFPVDDFEDAIQPWLSMERLQWSAAGEKLEGAGCWSPLFPARSDDVWLAAVATIKYLERLVVDDFVDGLHVFEQVSDLDLMGYRLVNLKDEQ